jgi:hypothetical protein
MLMPPMMRNPQIKTSLIISDPNNCTQVNYEIKHFFQFEEKLLAIQSENKSFILPAAFVNASN